MEVKEDIRNKFKSKKKKKRISQKHKHSIPVPFRFYNKRLLQSQLEASLRQHN